MPPPSNSPALNLIVLPEPFFVVKLQPGEEIPPCIFRDLTHGRGGFFSVTRTTEEVSLVGEAYKSMPASYKEQSTWMCIKVQGPMEHNLTGILASLTAPLKVSKVPIFALSTWNTDYLLVPKEMLSDAVRTLERDGWVFAQGIKGVRVARL
ncbi:Cytosolic arginine sensor for mTORC1 subunit 1 [Psilocybe cubensis]|uniref:Cytosolic arginine sensor for mTORC1 subunit 1 n=2 Tax=Psilocybe cubensis TaxID=181762 RepID=A0ACB8HEC9_PSICU|nr:Cytosolic arginine sensor for mTORC1 subunit 1 [Psilocybe cubensis]KAH9486291.1 Cytosolic arginine sensor for mTORC1 subunit 1 [Psilocybe cubensis]